MLVTTALAEGIMLVLTPRVEIDQGTIFGPLADASGVAAVIDVRSALAYGIGILVIGALCYWAAAPRSEVSGEGRVNSLPDRVDTEASHWWSRRPKQAVVFASGILIAGVILIAVWKPVRNVFSPAQAEGEYQVEKPVFGTDADTLDPPPIESSVTDPKGKRKRFSVEELLGSSGGFESSGATKPVGATVYHRGTAQRALDFAALGWVNADAYRKIREMRETGDLVTQADIEYFDRPKSGVALRAEPTLMETMPVDAPPVIVLGLGLMTTLIFFAYSMRKRRERSSKEHSLRYWKEGLRIGVGFAAWIAFANFFSPNPFSDRLADSAGAFLFALSAAMLIGIVSGAGATSISERSLSGNRIARVALTIALTFAQLGLFAAVLDHG